ncbi:hypothetical protein CPB86DRAFT_788751 [Serendipita vermifera]|nr:hypothetical protein CPB86DRAFT_788751 [Serendipita vermifera]
MSHHHQNGNSGHRGRGRGRHHGGFNPAPELPRNIVIRRRLFDLAEEEHFEVVTSLTKKLNYIKEHVSGDYEAMVEAFHIGITQQPFKMPYWATLLTLVTGPEQADTEAPWSNKILDGLVKAFQASLDKLKWRDLRLYTHFFAHLTTIGLITQESFLAQLSSFVSVLDEPGVPFERASMAAICAGEGLMRACQTLHSYSPDRVTDLLRTLVAYSDTLIDASTLCAPVTFLHSKEMPRSKEQIECLISALRELESDGFMYPPVLLRPHDEFGKLRDLEPSYELPSILVPPEIVSDDSIATTTNNRRRELPIVWLQIFDVEPSINPARAGGYLLRSSFEDIIDIYEVNRKEAARILLDARRWFTPGTFRAKPGAVEADESTGGVQLELSVMETILSCLLCLPMPKHKPVYYHALITEICKLSASTAGPAVGKSIRKLYALLGEGLDVELAKRFSDWFAVHMSNFTYQWVWKEWIPDLELNTDHPKRRFMRRALELEIRLSYYDRIMKTLPDLMQSPEAQVMPADVPGYDFEYEAASNPHAYLADALLTKLRDRVPMAEISLQVDNMRSELVGSGLTESRAASRMRSVTLQCILMLGSRSFSHFLNAIERYLKVLQPLSTTPDAKFEMLEIVGTFWRRNRQNILIIFDKLMQYQIADPTDVVSWAFEGTGLGEKNDGLSTFQWELMRMALDKSNGRVSIAQRRLVQQIKLDEEARAAKNAQAIGMDVDDIGAPPQEPEEDSTEFQKQTRAHQILVAEQKAVLSRAVEGFVTVLGGTDNCLSESAWENRGAWTKKEWDIIETWGWFRHFTRHYAPYLRLYKETLNIVYLSRVAPEQPAGALMRQIWSITVEQDS